MRVNTQIGSLCNPLRLGLSDLLGCEVELIKDYSRGVGELREAGQVVLLENVRFNAGEKADDEDLARRYAATV